MKPGNKIVTIIVFCLFYINFSNSEEKITSTPLIIDEIKPSFEEPDQESENVSSKQNLKEKNFCKFKIFSSYINWS